MFSKHIPTVVNWIREHPEQMMLGSDYVYEHPEPLSEDPAQIWTHFCQNPLIAGEYEDADAITMTKSRTNTGCTFIFSYGQERGHPCHRPCDDGTTRCPFHDHVIFSDELRAAIREYHDAIRLMCNPLPQ